MNALIQKVNSTDFVVLGFPSNIFGKQEPGTNEEIANALTHVRPGNGYKPLFPLMDKVDVNGNKESGLFTFLKKSCPGTSYTIGDIENFFWTPVTQSDITWNFEKFLTDTSGNPVKRYSPTFNPMNIYNDIMALLPGVESRDKEQNDGQFLGKVLRSVASTKTNN